MQRGGQQISHIYNSNRIAYFLKKLVCLPSSPRLLSLNMGRGGDPERGSLSLCPRRKHLEACEGSLCAQAWFMARGHGFTLVRYCELKVHFSSKL